MRDGVKSRRRSRRFTAFFVNSLSPTRAPVSNCSGNSGNPAKTKLLPFQALIDFLNDALFSSAFSAQAAQGIYTSLQGSVMELVSHAGFSNSSPPPSRRLTGVCLSEEMHSLSGQMRSPFFGVG